MAEIFGHEVGELPDNFYPTGVVVVVRGITTEDMAPGVAMRRSENLPAWEIIGLAYCLDNESKAAVDYMNATEGTEDVD